MPITLGNTSITGLGVGGLPAGTVNATTLADSSVNNAKLNLSANDSNIKIALNANNNPPIYACRAWVNFDGTTSPGTIRGSGNVSSVERNATGSYTVNLSTAMPDAGYCATISSAETATSTGQGNQEGHGKVTTHTTTSFRVITMFHVLNISSRPHNSQLVSVAVFR